MKNALRSAVLRVGVGVLLLAVLGGCAILHPYRMPTPKPSAEFLAQQKATAKARKNREPAFRIKKKKAPDAEEAATDVSTPSGAPVASAAPAPETRTLAERPTVKYDKQGLMKKPKLLRRRKNKPAPKPFRPWQSVRNYFKYNLHGKPNYRPDHRPAAPAPAPAPDAAPDAAPNAKP